MGFILGGVKLIIWIIIVGVFLVLVGLFLLDLALSFMKWVFGVK